MGSATIRAVLVDGQGHRVAVIERNMTTFEHEWYLLLGRRTKKVGPAVEEQYRGIAGQPIAGFAG